MYKLLLKQFAIVMLIILAILSIVFGAILPWMKSTLYINALIEVRSGRIETLDALEEEFGKALNFYSLIGDEEIVKYLSNDVIAQIITQNSSNPQAVPTIKLLIDYASPYLFMNNVRHLIFGAQAYQMLWQISGDEEVYKNVEYYFEKAYEIGPKLPPVLYGMFDLYKLKGDKENMKKIGEEILKYWPGDKNIQI